MARPTSSGVVIVPDDARVIRVAELHELYEIAGDFRTLGKAIGVAISTLSRWLAVAERPGASKADRIAAVRARLDRADTGTISLSPGRGEDDGHE